MLAFEPERVVLVAPDPIATEFTYIPFRVRSLVDARYRISHSYVDEAGELYDLVISDQLATTAVIGT